MRKILTKIATIVLIAATALTAFSGCKLVTTDTDRDMAQTVATVSVHPGVIDAEDIKKSEMAAAFMSYGYLYVQSYGYTVEATYELILKNLVQNRIIIQESRKVLAEKYNEIIADDAKANTEFLKYFKDNANGGSKTAIAPASASIENLEKYLTAYEIAQSKYNVKKSVNSMIDSYEEAEDADEKEDETYEVRSAPTVEAEEAEYEYELKTQDPTDYDYKVLALHTGKSVEALKAEYTTVYDVNMALYEVYKIDISGDRLKNLSSAIKDLKNGGLIKSEETQNIKSDPDNVLKYSYFENSIKNQYESLIVSKYEDSLVTDVESKLTNQAIYDQYNAEYDAQKENYLNNVSGYESALDALTEDSFVLCNPYEGYGYVLNLLIGFSDEQSAALKAEQGKVGATAESIKAVRDDLLTKLTVKDQRESWVYSSYGEYADGKFTFDKDYLVSDDEASLAKLGSFIGTVYGATSSEEEDDEGVIEKTWKFTNVIANTMTFGSFITDYVDALLGTSVQAGVVGTGIDIASKRAILDDLIYAFSTDPGSLGSYLGYAYSPFNAATTYVKEFANASKEVVAAGEGAYTLVATDYGYHLIICTKKVAKNAEEYADFAAFEADLANEETLASKYKEIKLSSIVSTEVGKIADKLINEKYEEEGIVTYNKKAYKDLIPESDDSSSN